MQKYGLVDTSKIQRNAKRSQWANKYNDRLPGSTLEGQPYEEGEVAGSRDDSLGGGAGDASNGRANTGNELWRPDEERYYGQNANGNDSRSFDSGSGGGRWHYPANFEQSSMDYDGAGFEGGASNGKKKKKGKKDRWARTEDAYTMPDDGGKKKKKKKKNRSTVGDADSVDQRSDNASTTEFPEDAVGGLYGDRRVNGDVSNAAPPQQQEEDFLNHQF